MMRINVAPLNNVVPETIVPALPFLFRSEEHMRAVLDGPIGDEILAAMEAQGFIGLAFYDSGARSMYTGKKPIKSAGRHQGHEDPRAAVRPVGRHDRGARRQPDADAVSARSTPRSRPASSMPPRTTSRPTNPRATSRPPSIYTLTEHSMAPEVLVFSKKIWDTLTPEDQAMIRKAAKESVPYMRKLWDEREAQVGGRRSRPAARRSCRRRGQEGGSDAMQPVYAKFANTPKLQEPGPEGPGHAVRPTARRRSARASPTRGIASPRLGEEQA